jgi:hypothetical protein
MNIHALHTNEYPDLSLPQNLIYKCQSECIHMNIHVLHACIRIYIRTYIYIHTHQHIHVHTPAYTCTHTSIYMYTHTSIYVYTYKRQHAHTAASASWRILKTFPDFRHESTHMNNRIMHTCICVHTVCVHVHSSLHTCIHTSASIFLDTQLQSPYKRNRPRKRECIHTLAHIHANAAAKRLLSTSRTEPAAQEGRNHVAHIGRSSP